MGKLEESLSDGRHLPLGESHKSINWFTIDSKFIISNKDRRLDPRQYSEEVYKAQSIIESGTNKIEKLGNLTLRIFAPPPVNRCFVKRGEPYLTPSELFNFRPKERKYVLGSLINGIEDWYIKSNWVVVTQSGNVGKPIFVNKILEKFVISQNAIRIIPNNKSNGGYIYAYLSTWIGQALLTKDQYGVTVKHLNPSHIANLPVPRLNSVCIYGKKVNLEKSIEQNIIKAGRMRDLANKIFDYAEKLFYKFTKLPVLSENDPTYLYGSDKKIFQVNLYDIIRAKDSRIDSTNYDPIIKTIENNLVNTGLQIVDIKNLSEKVNIPPRFKRVYVGKDYGYPYLRPAHLPLIRYYDQGYISKITDKAELYLLKENDILVTTDGTVGNIAIVTKNIHGYFGSNNIARITPKHIDDRGYIALYLMLGYGKFQLKKRNIWGVVDHINEKHIYDVKIPLLENKIRRRINKWVVKAFELKDMAMHIEDDTIRYLEEYIVNSSRNIAK